MYRLIRGILFLFPPEVAHSISMSLLKIICFIPFIRKNFGRFFQPVKAHPVKAFGLKFSHPVGLGAGFDKNAEYLEELEALGFSFVEIGTVTPKPQSGNAKPRVFRLIPDQALVNRMGFNNDGVEVVKQRLKKWRQKHKQRQLIIAGNIGKNKVTPNEDAWKDYEICFRALHPYVDFFVINVSSPNTPGLRELQEKHSLKKIIVHLQEINKTFQDRKSIVLKIAPDLTPGQLDDIIEMAKGVSLDGIVITNTTVSREGLLTEESKVKEAGAGGLSGKPLKEKSTEILKYVKEKLPSTILLIGSGGIFTAADANERIAAGATLLEVWTGFIYIGPFITRKICKGLKS
ncbi:MAG: quinone-dependent dihydroorotate dehydrogenase [Candidatus Dadabacteria bacterium]